jgi:hypothetical protein
VISIGGKVSDMFYTDLQEYVGYVPDDFGIGGGDYIEFHLCFDCGQLQGKFPLPMTELETTEEAEDGTD